HASNSLLAAMIFGYFYKKLIPVLTIAVLIIGVSRPYLGVHYPSDILGGWATGFLTAGLILILFNRMKNKFGVLRI
ncbi:MAG TPA: phosphatase PAP2 family protein, partial [Clostridiales bacterium]|nr:phosphatase PAP2 family protein [Clostridiales bacterium]